MIFEWTGKLWIGEFSSPRAFTLVAFVHQVNSDHGNDNGNKCFGVKNFAEHKPAEDHRNDGIDVGVQCSDGYRQFGERIKIASVGND